jgi:hypothetical protein
MRILRALPPIAGSMLVATTVVSLAQDIPNPSATPHESPAAHSVQYSAATDPEAAQNQPWMATGSDWNGPPQRLPAGQMPE